jgi:hypothetical protein
MEKKLILGLVFFAFATFSCQEKTEEKNLSENKTAEATALPAPTGQTASTAEATDAPAGEESSMPTMDFESIEHNFGSVTEGTKVKHIFKFKNNGKSPLIIADAKTSCGCTVPEYPKNVPIQPGQEEQIKVEFDTNGKSGNQMKDVTLAANIKGGSAVLRIVGNVDRVSNLNGPLKNNK